MVRLGSRKPIAVDVRIIAATNVELERAVTEGRFRRDLYYRLNVAAVELLALRARPGDILPLAQHFIDAYRCELSLGAVLLTDAARNVLLAHDWPGNIRELENVVHFGLIMSRNGVLDAADLRLPEQIVARHSGLQGRPNSDGLDGLAEGLRRLLRSGHADVYQSVERLLLTTAFEHCAGNQVHTARRLGVSRNVVRAQLKRHGLLERYSGS